MYYDRHPYSVIETPSAYTVAVWISPLHPGLCIIWLHWTSIVILSIEFRVQIPIGLKYFYAVPLHGSKSKPEFSGSLTGKITGHPGNNQLSQNIVLRTFPGQWGILKPKLPSGSESDQTPPNPYRVQTPKPEDKEHMTSGVCHGHWLTDRTVTCVCLSGSGHTGMFCQTGISLANASVLNDYISITAIRIKF
jgi:hypothetical protein